MKLRFLFGLLLLSSLFILLLYKPLGFIRLPFFHLCPFEAIPADTPMILELPGVEDLKTTFDDLTGKSNLSWLYPIDELLGDLSMIRDLFNDQPEWDSFFTTSPFLVAVQNGGSKTINLTYIFDRKDKNHDLKLMLNQLPGGKVTHSVFRAVEIYEWRDGKEQTLAIALFRNLILLGRLSGTLEDAIDQLKNVRNNLHRNKVFRQTVVKNPVEKEIRIYFNTAQLPFLLSGFITPSARKQLTHLTDLAPWMVANRNIATSKGEWTGEWVLPVNNLFFKALQPTPLADRTSIYKILPDHTAMLFWFALRDKNLFFQQPGNSLFDDLQTYLLPWATPEMAYVITEPHSAELDNEHFLVVGTYNPEVAATHLRKWGEEVGALQSFDYQTYTIHQMMTNDLVKPFLGAFWNGIHNPYYTIIDQYVVFCNSRQAMEVWIDHYLVGKSLSRDESFMTYQASFPSQTNSFLYLNTPFLLPMLQSITPKASHTELHRYFEELRRFHPIVLDIHPNRGNAELTGRFMLSEEVRSTTSIIWKRALSGEVITQPYIINNPITGQKEIFVQDDNNMLYLLDRGGDIKWKRKLEGRLLSEIYSIDYYNNGQVQFVFNTKQNIYVIDHLGVDFGTFPLKLQSEATNGVVVTDFSGRKEYHMYIACDNGNLYGFRQNGEPIVGWNPKRIGLTDFPVQHFQYHNKDHLMVLTREGALQVFRQDGQLRLKEHQFHATFHSPPGFQAYDPAPRMVVTNEIGKIHVINMEGETFRLHPGNQSNKKVQFVFADITGDVRKDYILLKDRQLSLYAYKKNAFEIRYHFNFENRQDAVFDVQMPHHVKHQIGTLCTDKNQIFLLTPDGQLHPDFPLAGTTPFVLSDLFGDGNNILVVGNEHSVYAYKVGEKK